MFTIICFKKTGQQTDLRLRKALGHAAVAVFHHLTDLLCQLPPFFRQIYTGDSLVFLILPAADIIRPLHPLQGYIHRGRPYLQPPGKLFLAKPLLLKNMP